MMLDSREEKQKVGFEHVFRSDDAAGLQGHNGTLGAAEAHFAKGCTLLVGKGNHADVGLSGVAQF